jgi:hypothetical protein
MIDVVQFRQLRLAVGFVIHDLKLVFENSSMRSTDRRWRKLKSAGAN